MYYMRYRVWLYWLGIMYTFSVLFLFVFVWEGGIGYRYLCIRIIKVVYIIRIRICDIMYLILFVGWDWWVFSLCMRIRMVIRDRITFRYVIFMVVGLYRLWLYHLGIFVISLLTLALWILSEDDFCLFLGWGSGDRDLVPQFCRGLPFPLWNPLCNL